MGRPAVYLRVQPVEYLDRDYRLSNVQSQSLAYSTVAYTSIDISVEVKDHRAQGRLSSSLLNLAGPEAPSRFFLRAIPTIPLPPMPPLFFGLSPKSQPQLTLQSQPTSFLLQDNKLQILSFRNWFVANNGEDLLVAVPDAEGPFGWTARPDSKYGLTLAPSLDGEVTVPCEYLDLYEGCCDS